MTEFWVSQANKWCEYCRCWLKDSAQSWAVHERGAKHQENVARSECLLMWLISSVLPGAFVCSFDGGWLDVLLGGLSVAGRAGAVASWCVVMGRPPACCL